MLPILKPSFNIKGIVELFGRVPAEVNKIVREELNKFKDEVYKVAVDSFPKDRSSPGIDSGSLKNSIKCRLVRTKGKEYWGGRTKKGRSGIGSPEYSIELYIDSSSVHKKSIEGWSIDSDPLIYWNIINKGLRFQLPSTSGKRKVIRIVKKFPEDDINKVRVSKVTKSGGIKCYPEGGGTYNYLRKQKVRVKFRTFGSGSGRGAAATEERLSSLIINKRAGQKGPTAHVPFFDNAYKFIRDKQQDIGADIADRIVQWIDRQIGANTKYGIKIKYRRGGARPFVYRSYSGYKDSGYKPVQQSSGSKGKNLMKNIRQAKQKTQKKPRKSANKSGLRRINKEGFYRVKRIAKGAGTDRWADPGARKRGRESMKRM